MDIEMPGQTGIEAARDFRDACPDCRVIILSLHDGKANKAAARAAGAFDFVCKHEPTESLLDAIRRAGERKSLAPA